MPTSNFNSRLRLERLRNRRDGSSTLEFSGKTITEAYERLQEDDAVKYVVGAMQPIDPEYTKNTFAEADRIKSQLESNFPTHSVRANFDFQGSVTNDTHILRYSDIDLLSITDEFVFKENVSSVLAPHGNPYLAVLTQHNVSVEILKAKFPGVSVDTSGGKAIQLSGGSLRRKVDVITTAWWDTIAYDSSRLKKDRGIKVFTYNSVGFIANKPFLHNHNIEIKDNSMSGNLRKAIRFLKTIKADANEDAGYAKIDISSYDICAICHAMGYNHLLVRPDEELILARNIQQFLEYLEQSELYRNTLLVPNETRKIFCAEGASVDGLRQLNREVKAVLDDISQGLSKTYRTLEGRLRR